MTRRGLLADAGLLAAALLIYGALSLPHLDLPGLYYDEAVDAIPAMQLLTHQEVTLTRGAGVEFRSRQLPLMAMDYVGAVHTYAAAPFFAWFGVGAVPLRLMTVAGGALTVALTFVLGRMLFGSAAGALAALLLAVHPSFIFYVRQGVHVSSLLSVMTVGSLVGLWHWRRTGSVPALLVGSFLLGLGLWTKILFLWHITALVAVGGLMLTAD
ncbi:MAG: hypothetical protein NTZ05_04585, partial [Chloroflexi bacterium]|nr:hypothetical protein [Chloroflexota bacterium]